MKIYGYYTQNVQLLYNNYGSLQFFNFKVWALKKIL